MAPFVRRDLRARLISAVATFGVLVSLVWLASSALTHMDTAGAHRMRVQLGLETQGAVCGGYKQPICTYDDAEQTRLEDADAQRLAVRTAIFTELARRIETQMRGLHQLKARVDAAPADSSIYWAEDPSTLTVLDSGSDLSPLVSFEQELAELTRLRTSARQGGERFSDELSMRLASLQRSRARLTAQMARAGAFDKSAAPSKRNHDATSMLNAMRADGSLGRVPELARWLEQSGPGTNLADVTLEQLEGKLDVMDKALSTGESLWQGSFESDYVPASSYTASAIRYASPMSESTRWLFLGLGLLSLAVFFLLVVSPTVTATETAKERDAGTLPVLRMTGMSADDLVAAMVVGPNVFALTTAALCLAFGVLLTTFTAGPAVLALPLALLAVSVPAMHLVAIGLGDALGQRVNAIVVGAIVALGVIGPGLIGAALVGLDVANTGLLLGPLPALAASTSEIAGIRDLGLNLGEGWLGSSMLGFAVISQLLLGWVCLRSWRRRVEQPWSSLFSPVEGAALALLSIGASALSLIDLSGRTHAQDFDSLNLLTFVSCSFLVPLLGWLLVTSLRRPARARARANAHESRRAFMRFQGLVFAALGVVGLAYTFVLNGSSMGSSESELMWATLAQGILLGNTAVAAFLWVSRREFGKFKAAFVSGTVLMLQAIGIAAVYGAEVEQIGRAHV